MSDEFWLEEMSPDGFSAVDGIMRGDPGPYFTPAVDSNGNISWTNNGNLPNPQTQNIKGPAGKSAYQHAVDGGYTGTEEQFNEELAAYAELSSDVDDLKSAKAPVIIDTASGTIASFEDGADNMPLKSLTVNIEPVQAAGTPTPETPLPISGWTGCNIYHSRSNICDEDFELGAISSYGSNSTADDKIRTVNFIPCRPNTTYYYKGPDTIGVRFYDASQNHLGSPTNIAVTADSAFTTPVNAYFLRFFVFRTTEYENNIAINYPPTITTYSPYANLPVISVAFPSEVYGGTLDVTSGVLTVDRAIVDVGDLTMAAFVADLHMATYTISNRAYGTGITLDSCSNSYDFYGYASADGLKNNLANAQYGFQISSRSFRIRDDRFSTAEDFAAAMAGVKIVYYLAAPIEITLSAQQIDTLFGTNNIWADCGPVSVNYPADTKLFIQKVNKPTDDDMTADTQIASGKYFLIGNTLYLSTTVIPAGDTIIPGTNCTKTNLAAALNALNT